MSANLPLLIDRFEDQRVLVIGDAILDSYFSGLASRLCREAPVPIVQVLARQDRPGGAANAAANARALGVEVTLLSVVGNDAEGERLQETLRAGGISTDHVLAESGRQTLAKHRVVADGQILLRFDQGTTTPMAPGTEQMAVEHLRDLLTRHDTVVVSDYGYGVLTPRLLDVLADGRLAGQRTLVVDSKNLPAYRRIGPTAAKPNYDEAMALLGQAMLDGAPGRLHQVAQLGDQLLDRTGAHLVAVTLDADGAVIFERGSPPYRTYAQRRPGSLATGAGDTFVVALALSLAAGGDRAAAAEIASAAAAVVVDKDGTAVCTIDELRRHFTAQDKVVASLGQLASLLDGYHRQRRRIVFTNGCFDLLHSGHITTLNRAKALGDILVVGVNADESVKRLKGADRPINPLPERVQVLAALSCIDHLVPFDEDTSSHLVQLIRPDVFVKGGNYTTEHLPEAPLVRRLGGSVEILPYVPDRSTAGLIERIRGVELTPAIRKKPASGKGRGHDTRLGTRGQAALR